MDFTILGRGATMDGPGKAQAHALGSQAQPIRMIFFPHKRALLQREILLSFISCAGGWSQTIPQVKKPNVEVLGWRGYEADRHTAKLSKTTLEPVYGREINITLSGNIPGGQSCSQHANCTLPQNLKHVALCRVTKLNILKWPFIVPQHKVHLCNDHAV